MCAAGLSEMDINTSNMQLNGLFQIFFDEILNDE